MPYPVLKEKTCFDQEREFLGKTNIWWHRSQPKPYPKLKLFIVEIFI